MEHRKTQVWADSTLCWVVEQRESEEHSSEISRLLLGFSRKVFWEVGGPLDPGTMRMRAGKFETGTGSLGVEI